MKNFGRREPADWRSRRVSGSQPELDRWSRCIESGRSAAVAPVRAATGPDEEEPITSVGAGADATHYPTPRKADMSQKHTHPHATKQIRRFTTSHGTDRTDEKMVTE